MVVYPYHVFLDDGKLLSMAAFRATKGLPMVN